MEADDDILNALMEEIIDEPPANDTPNVEMESEEIVENSVDVTENVGAEDEKAAKSRICELPMSKIKGIMKLDPEVYMVGSEAVFAVCKAAELFLQTLAKQSYKFTAANKKKTVQRSHVNAAVDSSESLFFLEDALD